MFRIAVCDEDRMARKRMKQVVMTYMGARNYETQVIESLFGNEAVDSTHLVLDLQEMVTHKLEKMLEREDRMIFFFREGEKRLAPSQVVYVESKLHRLYFHLQNEEVYTMYDVLNEWEEKLKNFDFLRIHQSYLVNMRYIRKISSYAAHLEENVKLTIPRARYRQVREKFVTYQKGEEKNESK